MQQQLLTTNDGSHTIFVPQLNESYHSTRGAVQESLHVFVNAGFNTIQKNYVQILEIGFGTGLNALLTLHQTICQGKKVYYEAIEAYPLDTHLWQTLNYNSFIPETDSDYFTRLHAADWGKDSVINEFFTLKKISTFLNTYTPQLTFDLIYFDAFAPDVQPEMWTTEVFEKMANALNPGGILVTYSAKGSVKQNLRNSKFIVNRLQGACGKHHMIRAIKV